MKETRSKNIFIRISETEKKCIAYNAEACGLTVSEYLRQRALGYKPKAILPEVFWGFSDKLDQLCAICAGRISEETEDRMLALIDEIIVALVLPEKEKEVM